MKVVELKEEYFTGKNIVVSCVDTGGHGHIDGTPATFFELHGYVFEYQKCICCEYSDNCNVKKSRS